MIVEFIGSTGAGKTTLIREVQDRLGEKEAVVTSFDVVANRLGLREITNPTVKNFIQEMAGFPYFVRSLGRHKEFVSFSLRMLARQSSLTLFTINNLRSLERKIGVYEIIRRKEKDRTILVDEGTVLVAHNVFVYTDAAYSSEEIDRFANLVPLPDVIVYIKAPVDILIRRSLMRARPPREMKSKNPVLIEKYVNRAVKMFDQLVKAESIQCRLLMVENTGSNGQSRDEVVDCIIEFIMKKRVSGS